MITVHKVGKLADPVTFERAWRRAQRYLFPLPLRPIVAGLDQARLREIQARYQDVPRGAKVERERLFFANGLK